MPALRPRMRRPAAPLVIASLALFVALGGPAEAGRLLGGGDIKRNSITSRQIKDRSLEVKDLSRKARRSLTATPAGSIADAELADGAVTARAVADATLTAQDLAANSVGTEEVGDNA